MHPISGRGDDDDRRHDERERGGDVCPRAPRDHQLDAEDKPARHDGDSDEFEEAAPAVLAVGETRRVQCVDAAEQVRDLERDEEDKEGIDRQQHRRACRRAQDAAEARKDRRERRLRAPARDH